MRVGRTGVHVDGTGQVVLAVVVAVTVTVDGVTLGHDGGAVVVRTEVTVTVTAVAVQLVMLGFVVVVDVMALDGVVVPVEPARQAHALEIRDAE
jgi:hypothetical protein